MSSVFDLILDDCLGQVRKGVTVEECLCLYPEHAETLRPLLELAGGIEKVPHPKPSEEALSELMIRVGQEMVIDKKRIRMRPSDQRKPLFARLLGQRKLIWAVNVAFLFMATVFGASALSANSMPGDFLYPLKLVTDKVVFMLTVNSEKRAELRITYSEKRLQEMMAGLQRSDTLDVDLLKAMLDEAKLALEGIDSTSNKKPQILARLDNLNTYQKTVLTKIRPQVDSSDLRIVDEAISMCDMRGSWMRRMSGEDYAPAFNEQDTSRAHESRSRPRQESPRESGNCQWGPGCDW